jgi:hypothetical protein
LYPKLNTPTDVQARSLDRGRPIRPPRPCAEARFPVRRAVVAGLCLLLFGLLPAAAFASSQPPPNDNFLDSDNLNVPGRPLTTVNTLSSSIDTSAATTQPNLLSPCGEVLCAAGPVEPSTCKDASYGKTVWYDFYPDHDGQIEIRTDGIPNVIALYSYNAINLAPAELRCAEGSKYPRNELSENVRRGVDYTVQIGGRNDAGGPLHVLFNYVYRTHLTVPPFFTSPGIRSLPGKRAKVRLRNFKFIGVAAGETISAACGFCTHGDLRQRVRRGNTLLVEGSKPIIGRRSRLLIAATAPAQVGRFKVYAYRPDRRTLLVMAQGCLSPGVTRLTAIDAEHLAALPRIPCPVRLVNPIGGEYVFWRGPDNRLREKWYSGTTWSPTLRLKFGGLASPPSVAVHAKGEQDVFWRSTHGRLEEAWYNGQWNGAVDIGGGGLASAPSAGADGSGREYVFWRGRDGGLWEQRYVPESWTLPFPIRRAGLIGSAPAVAVHTDGEQDVFWKGTNGNLWEIWTAGPNEPWNGPQDLGGGQLGSAPSTGSDAAGNDYVVWRGTDHRLWGKSFIAGRWNGAMPLNGGVLGSPPAIAVEADGDQDVFWRGVNDHLWETTYSDGHWQVPVSHGGRLSSEPQAGVDAAGKQATATATVQAHRLG